MMIKLLVPACALATSLLLGGFFIYAIGADPVFIYGRIASETLGNWYGLGQVLFKSTTFLFTGLAAALAFRTGLFNIGAEGQLIMGAFAMAFVGVACSGLPVFLLIPLCLVCGFLAGAAWAAVPGALKSKYGAHEVITTIMMNFIAAALVSYWINNVFGVPATVHTAPIASSAMLIRLDTILPQLRGSPVNLSFVLAFLGAILLQFFITRTRIGYELRTAGLSKDAASYAGIPVASRSLLAL
ncbi:MAG TPA: ABC transporter permease, partial [Bacteroidota bacterium]|nr:ABC transporter permease [Bacteroidota bacterium]